MRRKRTDDEENLLKLLQGMKPQDGFTTWCEQMLHTLNTSASNSSSLDGNFAAVTIWTEEEGDAIATLWSLCRSCYDCGLPEGGGVSLGSVGLHPVLPGGHSGSQRVHQTVSGATCQTEGQPTETAAAGKLAAEMTSDKFDFAVLVPTREMLFVLNGLSCQRKWLA